MFGWRQIDRLPELQRGLEWGVREPWQLRGQPWWRRTLGGNAVGVSVGTLREGTGQSGCNKTAGEGHGDLRSGAVGGLVVRLEKMRESVWMAAN